MVTVQLEVSDLSFKEHMRSSVKNLRRGGTKIDPINAAKSVKTTLSGLPPSELRLMKLSVCRKILFEPLCNVVARSGGHPGAGVEAILVRMNKVEVPGQKGNRFRRS